MDYIKKSDNSLIVMQNGKIIESDRTQPYENPREKKVQGVHNGKAFAFIQKKPKFSLFPEKQVSFLGSPIRKKRITYRIRTPTPYPITKQISRKKRIPKKNKKNNKTQNKNKKS
jgi:ABC-type methionine transport system ATPase subunit